MDVDDDNPINVQEMSENIVGSTTFDGYKLSILEISAWAWENQDGWLTEEYVADYENILLEVADMRARQRSRHLKEWIRGKLASAGTHPIIVVENLTPERFMEYLDSLRNQRTGARLGKSQYGNKRAALHHLFRCHEGLDGYPAGFEDRLSNLMRGFTRVLTQRDQDDGAGDISEGKDAMSVDLYFAICRWFLEKGTMEGVWCHCFIVLTWNLMCRVNNTTRICVNHMTWYQDCLRIHFKQQKGDQLGLTARYPRHLYANPGNPMVSPIFALGLYFLSFGVPLLPTSKLFPGRNQYKRFGRLLKDTLEDHLEEVRAFGFEVSDIGTHSIRKGATTYLSSQPGGPAPASICIRAGWTLGGVKDVYIKYEQSGDMFCGRSLSMMPLLQPQFGAAPPSFKHGGLTPARIRAITEAIYPALSNTGLWGAVTKFALSSLIFHQSEVEGWPVDHYVRTNCQLFRSAELLAELSPLVHVQYPWDTVTANDPPPMVGTGIPPHVAILQELRTMGEASNKFIKDFSRMVHEVLDERAVEVGGMSGPALARAIQDGTREIRDNMERMALRVGVPLVATPGQGPVIPPQARHTWMLHLYGGTFHVLPQQWRFPSCTPIQVWVQWLLGDTVNEVPPLKMLTGSDVVHLDGIPLPAGSRRRLARKTLCDLRFVMNVIERNVRRNGRWTDEHTLESVNGMFQTVATLFVLADDHTRHRRRTEHLKWQTFVPNLRRLHRQVGR
jgi:hypothetical protein